MMSRSGLGETMYRYELPLIVATFFVSSVSAPAQTKSDIYEVQERCAKRAEQVFKQDWGEGVANIEDRQLNARYENHYSLRLNKCFYLEITTSYERDGRPKSNLPPIMKRLTLFDINENKEYASFHDGPIAVLRLNGGS